MSTLEILDGDRPERRESYCGVCFEKITSPMLKGIWYHERYWNIMENNERHEPVPASPIVLLYLINSEIKTGSRGYRDTNRKCKKHDRYWNDFLGFPKIVPGWRVGHFYDENYIALCGKVIEPKNRRRDFEPDGIKSVYDACQKCRKKRLEQKNIPEKELKVLNQKRSYW